MRTPWTASSRRLAYGLALASVSVAAVAHYRSEGTTLPVDDAYITLHNAEVLRRGIDPQFAVAAMVGATSAAHTVLLAIIGAVVHGEAAGWLGAWVGIAVYVTGVTALGVRHRISRWDTLLLVLLSLVVAEVPHQLTNGLETGLAMGALAWCLALTEPGESRSFSPLQPLLCGLLPFLRPELSVASAALLATRWLRLRAAGALDARRALTDLGLATLAAAPWALINLVQLGALVPSTIAAKRAFFAEGCIPGHVRWEWVRHHIRGFAGSVGYASRSIVLWPLAVGGRVGLITAAALVVAFATQFPGALGHYEYRYQYVLLPFGLAALAASRAHPSRWIRGVALALTLVGIDASVWHVGERWRQHRQRCAFTRAELAGVTTFVRTTLPRDARVLVHDVGYMAFASERSLVDLVGLKTPPAVALHQQLTWATCGPARAEAVHRLALATRPSHLVVLDSWDAIYRIVEGLRSHGWVVERVRSTGRYQVFALTPPQSTVNRPPGPVS